MVTSTAHLQHAPMSIASNQLSQLSGGSLSQLAPTLAHLQSQQVQQLSVHDLAALRPLGLHPLGQISVVPSEDGGYRLATSQGLQPQHIGGLQTVTIGQGGISVGPASNESLQTGVQVGTQPLQHMHVAPPWLTGKVLRADLVPLCSAEYCTPDSFAWVLMCGACRVCARQRQSQCLPSCQAPQVTTRRRQAPLSCSTPCPLATRCCTRTALVCNTSTWRVWTHTHTHWWPSCGVCQRSWLAHLCCSITYTGLSTCACSNAWMLCVCVCVCVCVCALQGAGSQSRSSDDAINKDPNDPNQFSFQFTLAPGGKLHQVSTTYTTPCTPVTHQPGARSSTRSCGDARRHPHDCMVKHALRGLLFVAGVRAHAAAARCAASCPGGWSVCDHQSSTAVRLWSGWRLPGAAAADRALQHAPRVPTQLGPADKRLCKQ